MNKKIMIDNYFEKSIGMGWNLDQQRKDTERDLLGGAKNTPGN